jgi:hypothetical protein
MKCPHCNVEIHPDFHELYLGNDNEGHWSVYKMVCPNLECEELIIQLSTSTSITTNEFGTTVLQGDETKIFVKPLVTNRPSAPKEVTKSFAEDYNEASVILTYSPKASAALSRRCLQSILRDKAKVKKSNLANEIQEVIDSNKLPSHLSQSIDAVRNIGNFAAHPLKSKSTGEIVEVESGEAEWLLDVLDALFDHYFVQPAILKQKKDSLNKKLKDLGKPEMK